MAGQQQRTQGADKYMSDVYEMLGMTMSTQQQTFWSQRQKKGTNDAEYKKKPTRKRKRSEAIHSSRFETMKQEKRKNLRIRYSIQHGYSGKYSISRYQEMQTLRTYRSFEKDKCTMSIQQQQNASSSSC